MESKLIAWMSRLAPAQRLAVGGGTVAALTGVVWFKWGFAAVGWATLVLLLVGLAVFGVNQWLRLRSERRAAGFKRGLIDDIRKAKAEIGAKFEEAIEKLRGNQLDVYRLPWYFFLGEPQSGKSYTIKRSELRFPIGRDGVSGEGGTRACDFWFTNNAVIVDTAGRLSLQEDKVVDAEQWNEVLKLLRRWRPNCPINGVLLGIPCTSLIGQDAASRNRAATILGTRLKEMQVALGIRFPVFIIVLKSDLVYGFDSFFKRLPVEESRHKQLLGWSNDAPFDQPFDPESFGDAFDSVVERLRRWRLKFMADEPSVEKVDSVYVLPEELGNLKQALWDYVRQIFERGEYGQPGFLRGLYFTSSIQQGQAIPIAVEALREAVGAPPPVPKDKDAEKVSTPFFIRDLYEEKVIPEKGLILRTDRSRFGNSIVRLSSLWGGAAALVIALVMITVQWFATGDVLKDPGQWVARATSNDTLELEINMALDLSNSLGARIEAWQARDSGWFSGVLYPNPEDDVSLINDLKVAYWHIFEERLLRPRLQELAGQLSQTQTTDWSAYLVQRDRLLCLLGLRYKPLRGQAFVPGTGGVAVDSTPPDMSRLRYLLANGKDTLETDQRRLTEFSRYLRLGGDPRRLGPDDENLNKVIAKLDTYLDLVLADPFNSNSKSTPTDEREPLFGWRRFFDSANQLREAYGTLLGADRSNNAQAAGLWASTCPPVKSALTECRTPAPNDGSIDGKSQELNSQIMVCYYDHLVNTVWGQPNTTLSSRVASVRARLEAKGDQIRAGLQKCAYITQPEIDKVKQAIEHVETLLLPPESGNDVEWIRAEQNRVQARKSAAGWLDVLSDVHSEAWNKEQLVSVLQWFHQNGYGTYWQHLIDRHGNQNQVPDAGVLKAFQPEDAYFKKGGQPEGSGATGYDAECYAKLAEHVVLLAGCASQEKQVLAQKQRSNVKDYRDEITKIGQDYIDRYLTHYKNMVNDIRLFKPDANDSWQGYCDNSGEWSCKRFVNKYVATIKDTKKLVDAVRNEANDTIKSKHAWAAVLQGYDEAKLAELEKSLRSFADVFAGLKGEPDGDLMLARSGMKEGRTVWEAAFLKVRDWSRSGQPLQGDVFSQALLAAEIACREKLCSEAKEKFDAACNNFADGHRTQLSGKFPFFHGTGAQTQQGKQDKEDKEEKAELTPEELRQLYADQKPNSLRALLEFTGCFKESKESENSPGLRADGARWKFASATADLRDLLFDKQDYKEVKLKVGRANTRPALPHGTQRWVEAGYGQARITLAGASAELRVTDMAKIPLTWRVSTDGRDSGESVYEILDDQKRTVVQLNDERGSFLLELRVPGYWSLLRLLHDFARLNTENNTWVVDYDVGRDAVSQAANGVNTHIRYRIYFTVEIQDVRFSGLPDWSDLEHK